MCFHGKALDAASRTVEYFLSGQDVEFMGRYRWCGVIFVSFSCRGLNHSAMLVIVVRRYSNIVICRRKFLNCCLYVLLLVSNGAKA